MEKIKCFEFVESVSTPNKFLILPIHENLNLHHTNGSYHVLCARVMNMSYATYLRLCRDVVGARIVGKNQKYPIPIFEKTKEAYQFLELLNARCNLILLELAQKDKFETIIEFLREKNPRFLEESGYVYN